ncbi:MAG: AAA family ATPase [Mycoplasmatales bacterium]|nr:AAA family ATPase [Mycoplasmatales bacterium]
MKKKDWFRFDLHSHTNEDCKTKRSINIKEVFKQYIKNGVRLIAVTNHNILSEKSVNEYNGMALAENENFLALNGAELDIYYDYENNKDKRFQILSIVNEENIEHLRNFLERHYIDDGTKINEKNPPTLTKLIEYSKLCHSILIPHFYKQGSQGLKFTELNKLHSSEWDEIFNMFHFLEGNVKEGNKEVISEALEGRSLKGLLPHIVRFSDKKTTSEMNDTTLKKMPLGNFDLSYDGLVRSTFSKTMVLPPNDKIPESEIILQEIEFNGNKIELKSGLTTIIGEMGSGKSSLLNSLISAISMKEFPKWQDEFYKSLNIKFKIEDTYATAKEKINVSKGIFLLQGELQKSITELEFEPNKVLSGEDAEKLNKLSAPISFLDYTAAIKEYTNNSYTIFDTIEKNLENYNENLSKTRLSKQKNAEILLMNNLMNEFKKKQDLVQSKMTNEIIINETLMNVYNKLIGLFEGENMSNIPTKVIDATKDIKTLLEKTIIEEFRYSSNKRIVNDLNKNNLDIINFINEKKLKITTSEHSSAGISRTKIFEYIKTINSNAKNINKQLSKIMEIIEKENEVFSQSFGVKGNLNKYIKLTVTRSMDELTMENIFANNFSNFKLNYIVNPTHWNKLKVKTSETKVKPTITKELKVANQVITTLSPGQRQALIIKEIFAAPENKIIILDQPEDNLDARTVSNAIVKSLLGHAIQKQIIIVTHDPKIVINADAKTIILAEKTETSGNIDLSYKEGKVVGITKNTNIAELIDGQKEYIYNRSKLYTEDRKKGERND